MSSPLLRTWGAVMRRLAYLVVLATPDETPEPSPFDFAGVGAMASWRMASRFTLDHPRLAAQLLAEADRIVPPSPKQQAEDAEMLVALWRAR